MRNLVGPSDRRYVRLSWGQVHLRTAGAPGNPALVMLHQSPLSSATFEAVLPGLAARGLHVVAPDTPGFGMSDATPQQWTIADYADGLSQLFDALGLDRVALLGQHTGAVVATEVAIQEPARVVGLICQGLPLYSEEERTQKKASYALSYEPTIDGSHLAMIWDRVRGLYPELGVDEVDRQVLEYLATGPDYGTAYRAVFDHRVPVDTLREVPTALVHGERDLVHRLTEQVTAAMPWAELVLVPGTDFAMDEHPEEFVDAVASRALAFHDRATTTAGAPSRSNGSSTETRVLHTAAVDVTGGRGGRATSSTGTLDLELSRPAQRGHRGGTDPEELFAAGYAACFDSAIQVVSRREGVTVGPTTTSAAVSLCADQADVYSIAVELTVTAPECDQATLERMLELTDQTCPYSQAVRGNVPVTIAGVGRA